MEQFRQVGEVVGSLKALMVLKHEISINQRQCCLLFDMMQLAFETISEEILQYLRLDEKNIKWKALELPLKELHRTFKDAECYIRYCTDVKDWWGKAISMHMNKDCVELHMHNLLSCFATVIEAIETAAEISGVDQHEIQKKRMTLVQKYDQECDDPNFFLWKFGKQYLVPKEIRCRLETTWKEDRWVLLEKIREKKTTGLSKNEQRLAELLLRKLSDGEASRAKIHPCSILVGAQDYNVRRRLGTGYSSGGGHLKEIHWLGESFALRAFYGDISHLIPEISSVLTLSHPSVMQYFCAFYDEGRKEGFLVMELMSKDLGSYIKEHSGQRNRLPFSIPVAVDIMLQIARGMEYLHSKEIYHGELNPSHILLKAKNPSTGSFQAKITGFGIASIKSCATRSPKSTGVNLDIWLAPEVLAKLEQYDGKSTMVHTEKADVYSFGMLCFELLTGKIPFEDSHLQGEKMARNILAGERPLFSYPPPKYLANLTKKCWQANPNLRPSFSSICRILRYIKKILVINPDHGDPYSTPPPVDYCDMEAAYLNKFPMEGSRSLAPVTQIPFQMFAYKIIEKEKISSKKLDLTAEGLPNPLEFDDEQLAAMDDLFPVPCDQRTVCSQIIDCKTLSHDQNFSPQPKREGPSKGLTTSILTESQTTTPKLEENNRSALTKETEKLENNGILEKRKSLRLIVDQKSVEIPELKPVSSTNSETKRESTAKSIGNSETSENSDKKHTLIRKLKAIKTKLIPETREHDSPGCSPTATKKTMLNSPPASSPSRAPKKESPKSALKRALPVGMKIMIPHLSPALSPSQDLKTYGNPESPTNDSPKFSPGRMKKSVSTFSLASSPSKALNTCASPSRASTYQSRDCSCPTPSLMNPNPRSSRLGRQTSFN